MGTAAADQPAGGHQPWPAEEHCAQLGCWGDHLVYRGGIGTSSAPWGCFSDKWGLISLTGPLGPIPRALMWGVGQWL